MSAVEELARSLFRERWPGKAWDGFGVARSYWRRKAKSIIATTPPAAQSEGGAGHE